MESVKRADRRQATPLLLFACVDDLCTTNNEIERMPRTALITPKATAGGAKGHATMISVSATRHQKAMPILAFRAELQGALGNQPSLGRLQPART